MLGAGGDVVVGVWEGWEDGERHRCEVVWNTDYSEGGYRVGIGVFVLLRIARGL